MVQLWYLLSKYFKLIYRTCILYCINADFNFGILKLTLATILLSNLNKDGI